jgi:hypothetical protein
MRQACTTRPLGTPRPMLSKPRRVPAIAEPGPPPARPVEAASLGGTGPSPLTPPRRSSWSTAKRAGRPAAVPRLPRSASDTADAKRGKREVAGAGYGKEKPGSTRETRWCIRYSIAPRRHGIEAVTSLPGQTADRPADRPPTVAATSGYRLRPTGGHAGHQRGSSARGLPGQPGPSSWHRRRGTPGHCRSRPRPRRQQHPLSTSTSRCAATLTSEPFSSRWAYEIMNVASGIGLP